MSIASGIERIQLLVQGLRNKMISAGQAVAGDDFETLVTNLNIITSSGIRPVYTTDGTPWTASWLSYSDATTEGGVTTYGDPITPEKDNIYMIKSSGEYLRRLVTWDGTAYRAVGRVNVNGGVETELYVPNTATADGMPGLVPPAPAGTENAVFRWDGWGETPLDITTAEIDEIFGKVIPGHSAYTTTKTAIGTFNGKTHYRQTFENLNVSVSTGATATVLSGTAITQITKSCYYTATGTYVPAETAVNTGDVTIIGGPSSGTITACTLDFVE